MTTSTHTPMRLPSPKRPPSSPPEGRDKVRHVRDVHPHAPPAAPARAQVQRLDGQRVVQVLGRGRVDGEHAHGPGGEKRGRRGQEGGRQQMRARTRTCVRDQLDAVCPLPPSGPPYAPEVPPLGQLLRRDAPRQRRQAGQHLGLPAAALAAADVLHLQDGRRLALDLAGLGGSRRTGRAGWRTGPSQTAFQGDANASNRDRLGRRKRKQ